MITKTGYKYVNYPMVKQAGGLLGAALGIGKRILNYLPYIGTAADVMLGKSSLGGAIAELGASTIVDKLSPTANVYKAITNKPYGTTWKHMLGAGIADGLISNAVSTPITNFFDKHLPLYWNKKNKATVGYSPDGVAVQRISNSDSDDSDDSNTDYKYI